MTKCTHSNIENDYFNPLADNSDGERLQELDLTSKYMLTRNGVVLNVISLGLNEKGEEEFIEVKDVFTVKNKTFKLFDTKRDAMFNKLIIDLKAGKPLDNYKRSKYYNYYVKRLKVENPEYLI